MHEYVKTDTQLHWLSQLIAKANKAYLPPKSDDSHTNMYFDPLAGCITGRYINTGERRVYLGLNLQTLNFEWIDSTHRCLENTTAVGKTFAVLEAEMAELTNHFGLNPDAYLKKMHYEIPDYPFDKRPIGFTEQGLSDWQYFRKMANWACDVVNGHLHSCMAPRIWPHHFDTGIFTEPNDQIGIGFGLAMEDEMVGSPYYYLAGYSKIAPLNYKDLPGLGEGKWIINDGWKGAVLPLDRLPKNSLLDLDHTLMEFIRQALGWYMKGSWDN